MATKVELVKRPLKAAPGRRAGYRWHMRWFDANGKRCSESTGTADKVQAESLLKRRWAELNGIVARQVEPDAERPVVAWDECRKALEEAMKLDGLRPRSVQDALATYDALRKAYPATKGPAEVTPAMANELKRRRSKDGQSPWTIRGDFSTLRAIYNKWLRKECGLLDANPFQDVRAPRCEDPDVRIVSAAEQVELFTWLADRWHDWELPLVYLRVASLLGWRATEIASIRTEDLLADGFVRVVAATSKTRRNKHGWLPVELYDALRACSSGGWAFGRFSDDLRRLLLVGRKQANHAARVRAFTPKRLVGWMQDELKRFNDEKAKAAEAAGTAWERFTMHDFRRTAITGMQMSGVSEKEASVMVGATPEVIRRHYEKLDQLAIARRNVERRLHAEGPAVVAFRASTTRQTSNQLQQLVTASDRELRPLEQAAS